ncbi:MAG: hypothetical protein K5779_09695 [Saccharofermentans sp.]|nr:hypothetical protein [Saccharofermentans sp.]
MKITPAKDYKKPLYAIGISAAIMAVSVTGCTNLFGSNNGNEPVDLAGAADVRTDETEYCKKDADNDPEPVLAGEVELDGEVAIDDEVELDGDIDVDVDVDVTEYKKAWNDSPILDGGAPIDEN